MRGVIASLRSAIKRQRLDPSDVLDLCHNRITEDVKAVRSRSLVSSLNLPSTNAVVAPSCGTKDHQYVYASNTKPDEMISDIPFTVKDNFCVDANFAGSPTTCASRALENFRPMYTAAVIDALLHKKGVFLGKTNLDEFAMGCGSTDNPLHGPVVNPWSNVTPIYQAARIAGGSSGGSAASVAAGFCVVSISSDTGGSTRLPAALCGVVGLKPTYSLVSRHGLIPLANGLDTPSIMAPRVADIAAVLASWLDPVSPLARSHDSTCSPLPDETLKRMHQELCILANDTGSNLTQDKSNSPLRVGIPKEYYVPGLDAEVAETWDMAAGWLCDQLSCEVSSVELPHTMMANTTYSVLSVVDVASNMARYDGLQYGFRAQSCAGEGAEAHLNSTEQMFAATRMHGLGTVVQGRILAGNYFLLRGQQDKHLSAARRLWRLVKQDFDNVFSEVDFLLTPVNLTPAPLLSEFVNLDSRTRTSRDDVCTVAVNLAGLPAVAIPIRLSPSLCLPIGLQLIGPAFSEAKLLRLAAALEAISQFKLLVDLPAILGI